MDVSGPTEEGNISLRKLHHYQILSHEPLIEYELTTSTGKSISAVLTGREPVGGNDLQ